MAKKRWSERSPQSRRLIIAAGTFEVVLKIVALIDLARRPADEVRGPKARWAFALVLVNSVGLMPLAYFILGRKRHA